MHLPISLDRESYVWQGPMSTSYQSFSTITYQLWLLPYPTTAYSYFQTIGSTHVLSNAKTIPLRINSEQTSWVYEHYCSTTWNYHKDYGLVSCELGICSIDSWCQHLFYFCWLFSLFSFAQVSTGPWKPAQDHLYEAIHSCCPLLHSSLLYRFTLDLR